MADASSFDSPIIDSPVRAGEGSGLLHEVGPSWELRGVGVEDLYDASLAQVATEALHKDPADRGEADIMCITTWLAKVRLHRRDWGRVAFSRSGTRGAALGAHLRASVCAVHGRVGRSSNGTCSRSTWATPASSRRKIFCGTWRATYRS